jgi:hypothetical protein
MCIYFYSVWHKSFSKNRYPCRPKTLGRDNRHHCIGPLPSRAWTQPFQQVAPQKRLSTSPPWAPQERWTRLVSIDPPLANIIEGEWRAQNSVRSKEKQRVQQSTSPITSVSSARTAVEHVFSSICIWTLRISSWRMSRSLFQEKPTICWKGCLRVFF